MRYSEIAKLNENADCGTTAAASVATCVTPFFSFQPEVKPEAKPKKKKKPQSGKPVVIKR